jgi:hypothetical protein
MNISKKIAALAVAGAIVASGALVASSAQAAPLAGATLTITPLSGNVNTDTVFLNSLDINVTAPAGFQASGGTFVYQGGVEMGNISLARNAGMASTNGTSGLDGSLTHLDRVINPTNNFLSSKLLNQLTTPLVTGQFELRSYYFASATAPNRATDPYAALTMTYDAVSGAWAVFTPATATTTSLTASATGTTVALSATIKDGAGSATLTGAAGNVAFLEGATTVATSAVVAGVATASLTAVSNGTHTYTAVFTPTSAAAFSPSTSGSASVQVGGIVATSNITTTIPSGVGTLTLTGVSSSVALGTASLVSGVLFAQGTLNAVVTDTRQLDYPAWSLTGQVGNFTKTGGGVLDGKYLGWIPSVSGDATNSVAGATVAPAPVSTSGLKAISTFASGSPFAGGTITNAAANLQLKAPSNTPAGAYSATLTLTLI